MVVASREADWLAGGGGWESKNFSFHCITFCILNFLLCEYIVYFQVTKTNAPEKIRRIIFFHFGLPSLSCFGT